MKLVDEDLEVEIPKYTINHASEITNFQSVKKPLIVVAFFTLLYFVSHTIKFNDIHFSEQALLLHLQD